MRPTKPKLDQSKAVKNGRPQVAVNEPPPEPEISTDNIREQRWPIIPIDIYNKMYAAYHQRQSIAYVARTCGVHEATASRYIEKGDPKRRLPAIRDRWERAQQAAQMAEDYTLVKARREVQTVARAYLQRVASRIAKLDPAELDANKVIGQLQVTQAVIERTLGVADQTVTVNADDRFRGWTDEDLLDYARTGTIPTHARGNGTTSRGTTAEKENG